MMQGTYIRAGLAALIGMGVLAGLARAQQPAPPPGPDFQPWAVIEHGSPHYTAPTVMPVPADEGCSSCNGQRRTLRDWWRDHVWGRRSQPHQTQGVPGEKRFGCWSHHNEFLCSSWNSEFVFIFGSCREFFGEPCLKGPPAGYNAPLVLPPGEAGPRSMGGGMAMPMSARQGLLPGDLGCCK